MRLLCVLLCIPLSHGHESFLNIYVSEQSEVENQQPDDSSASDPEVGKFSLTTISNGPVMIITPTLGTLRSGLKDKLRLSGYYADKGLNSVAHNANFQSLHQLLLSSPYMSGLAYPGVGINDIVNLFNGTIQHVSIPDVFRIIDVVKGVSYKNIHFLYIAPEVFFKNQGFSGLKLAATFLINQYSIEPVSSKNITLPTKSNSFPAIRHPWNNPPVFLFQILPRTPYFIKDVLNRRYRQVSPFSGVQLKN